MSQEHPEKASVTFHDVCASFSQEEWKLLHEWQKELYKTVMKEIHQALISLGPLIATTVFSLKPKISHMDLQDSERTHGIINSPEFPFINPDICVKKDEVSSTKLMNYCHAEGGESRTVPSSELPFLHTDFCLRNEEASIVSLMDRPRVQGEENSNDSSSGHAVIPEAVLVCIKEEDETYAIDYQDSKRKESITTEMGKGNLNKQRKVGDYIKCSEKMSTLQAKPGKATLKGIHNFHEGTHLRNQGWSESNQELGGDKSVQCESGFTNSMHSNLQQGSSNEGRSDECESKPKNSQFLKALPNTQQNQRSYACTECDKSFNMRGKLNRHMRTHTGERPYACTECDNSFFQKTHLILHFRTHTGEKPYTCTFCYKSFNRKDNLKNHETIHTMKKQYECTECEKSFTRRDLLNTHRRKHI